MDFALFLLANAFFLIAPGQIFPEVFGEAQVYKVLIVVCLILTLPRLLRLLSPAQLGKDPVTVCVVGLIAAAALSHMTRLAAGRALDSAYDLFRVAAYYLLLIAIINTPQRLRIFLLFLVGCLVVTAVVAVAQFRGTISLPALDQQVVEERRIDEETGAEIAIRRLVSTGYFNDPNDISLFLVVGICLSLSWLARRRSALILRLFALVPVALFAYTLTLTKSRGGFYALLAAIGTLLWQRFGWKRACLVGGLCFPLLFLVFSVRQTSFDMGDREDSAQARVQLWSEGLAQFRERPLFGMGQATYADEIGQVAHNSFIHAYAELGILGGSLFFGMFASLVLLFRSLAPSKRVIVNPDLQQLRPYLVGAVVGFAVGLLSLSRCYVEPTFLVIGLGMAFIRLTRAAPALPPVRFDLRLAFRLGFAGLVFLAALDVVVRIFAQYT
jgi:hypothetical protein